MTKPQKPRRRKQTEFRVAPPLVQRIGAPGFTGLDLLENEDGPGALVFWQCYRDVEVWAGVAQRQGLFAPNGQADVRIKAVHDLDSGAYDEAKPHLEALVDVVRSPALAQAAAVADACSELARWFEGQGRLRCAVEFAKAACFAVPERAILAVRVGRLVRMLAEYPRAVSWFEYSVYLARKANDWQAYCEAFAGLGNLHYHTGNFPRARHFHRRCLRAARRNHLREMVGAAYHNLFAIEMDVGNVDLAEEYAAKAFIAYSPSSSCIVRLARDLSRRWTVLGQFGRSLPLALETLNHFSFPVDRAVVWADVARAAGGAGKGDVFEDAWAETWVLVRQGVTDPFTADVLLDLAHGAASLGDAARAARAAGKALEIASRRKEGRTILEAEALLDSLRLATPSRSGAHRPVHDSGERPGLSDRILTALRQARAVAA